MREGEQRMAARADAYVRGRMAEAEREEAERLLETDNAFRAAVMLAADRLGLFARKGAGDGGWDAVAEQLRALPHMRGSRPAPEAASEQRRAPAERPRRGGWLKRLVAWVWPRG